MWNWMSLRRPRASRGRTDAGVALPAVLVFAAFLVGVSGWLAGHLRTDLAMTTELERSHDAARVAEAALQEVAIALGEASDWAPIDGLALSLTCPPAGMAVTTLAEASERAWLQADVDADARWGVDTPRWQPIWACHGPGLLGRWPARGAAPAVLVWVADDPEGDGQPNRSENQRLLLTAVAAGQGAIRVTARAAVVRSSPGAPVRLLSWHGASGA